MFFLKNPAFIPIRILHPLSRLFSAPASPSAKIFYFSGDYCIKQTVDISSLCEGREKPSNYFEFLLYKKGKILNIIMERCKVFIDPSVRIKYSSYYIKGLYEVFGKRNVRFSRKYFKELNRKSESHSYDHYMAFVVLKNDEVKKYIIDFRDKRSVKESAYNWCDKYAKINFSETLTAKNFHEKMISIPPGFGIKLWGIYDLVFNCISNFLKCNLSPIVTFKSHLLDYYLQSKRPSLEEYTSESVETDDNIYIFMIGTLWTHQNCMVGTNLLRRTFVQTCKSMHLNFEGGFFSSDKNLTNDEFRDLIFTERYPTKVYVEKTKKSSFVFNTPAVHDCHGWKLGEYLAMGKAIISSPLSNELPENMVHSENIHIVSSLNELKDGIKLLTSNISYRKKLEKGTKNYYLKHASPKAVIENLT